MSKQLHNGQLVILELLYKYRFGSRQLIARSLGIKANSALEEKLNILNKHGYINKIYDKSFRFQGKPAIYSLTSKGMRELQAQPNNEFITNKDIQDSYRKASYEFMFDSLSIFDLLLSLQSDYPRLKTFTERDMRRYSYFPKDKPDALLSVTTESDEPRRYFFDYIPARRPHFATLKKVLQYAEFFEAGGWQPISASPPAILLVCEQVTSEKTLQQLINSKLTNEGIDDCTVYTSTKQNFINNVADAVWTNVMQTDETLRF